MPKSVIKIENVSKQYRFGVIGHGTLYKDVQSWWAKIRGKEDPNSKISLQAGPAKTGERFWALKDISFDVKEGEVLGIIGRNGAGKSTLLKILSRVTTPTEGYVRIRGRISSLLEVGTGFHPELTGRENVYLNGMIHGMTKTEIKKKFDEIVDFSGIEKFIDTPVKRYSSGMNVRLGFAVAAHLEPEVLIIDEVLAVGDVEFRQKCMEKMRDVSAGGRTVLFVSHRMSAIRELCQRGILLEKGKIVRSGPTEEVVGKYMTTTSLELKLNEDIPSKLHSNPNPDVEIYRIEMLDKQGRMVNAVKMQDDFSMKVYCKFNNSTACKIAMAFWDSNGVLIGRVTNSQNTFIEANRSPEVTLTINIGNTFQVGRYKTLITVRDKCNNLIDKVKDIYFDIFSSNSDKLYGVTQIKSEWNQE